MVLPYTIATISPAEYRQVVKLFRRVSRQHIHLDWFSLEDWLQNTNLRIWVARRNSSVEALIGAALESGSDDGQRILWLRFAIPVRQYGHDAVLDKLWDALRRDICLSGGGLIALLAMDDWVDRLVSRCGFERVNAVITLRRDSNQPPSFPRSALSIVEARDSDLEDLARIDAAAFARMWRYSPEALKAAAREAETMTLARRDGQVIGYQLSTRYADTGHLARLAVVPEAQRRGVGRALVIDMLHHFHRRGINIITVNTQADNYQSQRLYTGLGFGFTGHEVPVWNLRLP